MTDRALRQVIVASSFGSLFEFYDYYLYGSLATVIAKRFFSGLNDSTAFILTLLAFASGFLLRPFGSLVFGRLGDLAGRKRSFLITLLIMGGATFCVGCLPTYAQAGVFAPIALVALRMVQGLALGGEYGGAATYVAEFAAPADRGFATSWIQAMGSFGLMLSLIVLLACRALLGEDFERWGWRVPFLLSAVLLGISMFIRLRLRESPEFLAMKERGGISPAPLREAFGDWRNLKIVLLALVGVTVGQAMVTYTCGLYVLYFLTISLKINSITAGTLAAVAIAIATPLSLVAGRWSDRIGRKPVVLAGPLLLAFTVIPIFHALTHFGNPALEQAIQRAPVTVRADPARCQLQFDPLGKATFKTACDVATTALVQGGVPYRHAPLTAGGLAAVRVGTVEVPSFEGEGLDAATFTVRKAQFRQALGDALSAAGYPHGADPQTINLAAMLALMTLLMAYLSIGYGPLAAWLVEMFPPRIRYSAMSLPYHLGYGWFGGFLPAIAFAIVGRTGDIYSGLWYPVVAAVASVAVGWLAVPETVETRA